ncbi:hypothetical protein HRTV-25_gp97 [Halorubrum tailed virus 25]|uniref:Uncharacterized protein n=1 Tax=Halorubrum tailed virus 25 TaxID=2878006 RepID=A0AAE8Y150_9CAUD|nr:hypothetical protein M1M37_gp097 [Halorubrum tailed virus 25]UBF22678.1 hypothetical protein HRTV-25_gp97 [Halorubrum tailed virus 25]
MTQPNPTTITVVTPNNEGTVTDVRTWWREGPDLIVEKQDETTVTFPLGEVVDKAT